ncbi:putative amidotransferase [Citrobacter phage CVT22]|uniref:Amidotransferase n=1 Tax=Citrobacter phage CVT22 TaxID=1622234 RepID=A0A0R6CN44_9CAUD|nr:glutamine amidotransferase [Citrobacter phage CVT22]AJT60769.1 putative amidotransferase [Citrobacter phage CVT22]
MNIYIVGGGYAYAKMYENFGDTLVNSVEEADIIQFTGGEDVTPSWYQEHSHYSTYSNERRDDRELATWEQAFALGKFCVGICRGGQFLNVVNGGTMWQDVDGHAIHGTHGVLDILTGRVIECTSTHHQMMKAGKEGILVAKSAEMLSSSKRFMTGLHQEPQEQIARGVELETESVYYPATRSLCFQPHPEIVRQGHPCQEYFFELLGRYYHEQV